MRSFWMLQGCIAAAAFAGWAAVSGGCSHPGDGPGPYGDLGTCTGEDGCWAASLCCQVEDCAKAHCRASCFDACDLFYGLEQQCAVCLKTNHCPTEPGCQP